MSYPEETLVIQEQNAAGLFFHTYCKDLRSFSLTGNWKVGMAAVTFLKSILLA
jgi:hypothetical protein